MTSPSIHSVAHNVLARHVRHDIRSIRMWHSLDRDLHLTPLDLVIVALEVEEAGHVDVSLDDLARIETVGDFFMCLSKAAFSNREARACA